MEYPHKSDLPSPTTRTKRYLNIHYPGFVEYLQQKYPFCETLNESLYNYFERTDATSRPGCKVCGSPVKYYLGQGYMTCCSAKCSANDPDKLIKTQHIFEDKYGVSNPSQIKGVTEKRKRTCKERYNDENYTNKDKFRSTMLERYGDENPSRVESIMQKIMQTKSTHTTERKELIQQRYKDTCLSRYGTEHYTDQVSRRSTMLKRYGVPVYNNIEQMIQTCVERYGVERPAQSNQVKEKIRQTCITKYGVEYPCLRPETRATNQDSKPNSNFAHILDEHNISYEREYTIGKYAYDFKIENVLVEINPTPTHNSTWGIYGEAKRSDYHAHKSEVAKSHGFTCIHVWDWDDINKVLSLVKKKTPIYARKCIIKEVDKKECKDFLQQNHLQGSCNGQTIRIGLYYNDELVGLMTFGKPRYNKHYDWELLRLCYRHDVMIIGGSQKMFSHFINNYHGNIISYCDLSKFSGDVYTKLGFERISKPFPSKHWYNMKTSDHITNNMLLQRGYDQLFGTTYGKGYSNDQLMMEHGYVEVFDCGQATYIYKKRDL